MTVITAEITAIPRSRFAIASSPPQCLTTVEPNPTDSNFCSVPFVSQFSGVKPDDWAFQALQSLAKQYGLVLDENFDVSRQDGKGWSRNAFAVALNMVLQQLEQRFQQGNQDFITQEDWLIIQRLQAEFAPELSILRQQINKVENDVTELESNQFSTTTKLSGQVIFAVNAGGFTGDRMIAPRGATITTAQPQATFIYRASLNLNTSFTGTDLLQVRLVAGSNGADDNAAGFLEPNLGSTLEFSIPGREELSLARAYYTFRPAKDLTATVGASMVASDYIDNNRYAKRSFQDFSTQAFVGNFVLLPRERGAGAALHWNPGAGAFSVRAVYIAGDATNQLPENQQRLGGGGSEDIRLFPSAGGGAKGGLFGDPYQGVVELEYAPNRSLALRLQYSGGEVFGSNFQAIGFNGELALSDRVGIFGRYGYSSYPDTTVGDINPNYWMFGLAFPDLFQEGAIAGIAMGQPFIESDIGNATQTNFEAFYNFPVNQNIRITPLIQVIVNPGNQADNGTIMTGTIRTVFSF
ncbi:iron uptake porin [Richelia sinica]|uniref:iron uptake porin n=1 Tax=Richelia sinica TaxID=1357545 RepID=UPI00168855B5|nr:iron uptake porin [Richelia sinica]MBD2665165.1 iron uptake porin [Richelia sinica FACHB-800]